MATAQRHLCFHVQLEPFPEAALACSAALFFLNHILTYIIQH